MCVTVLVYCSLIKFNGVIDLYQIPEPEFIASEELIIIVIMNSNFLKCYYSKAKCKAAAYS